MADFVAPQHVFRFHIDFHEEQPQAAGSQAAVPLASGAFSECTGLEATMEPKVIKEGGRNYGAVQRVGPVTFGTVVLKRGITSSSDLWKLFEIVTEGKGYAHRVNATITLSDNAQKPILSWTLEKALPIKFKAPDLNATGTDIGIEELHLTHEGLRMAKA